MAHFSIAVMQLELSSQDNLYLIRTEIDKLVKRFPWVDMIVLPELATLGADIGKAQPLPGEIEKSYCEMAQRHGIWLIPGSLYEQCDDLVYNTAPVISPTGEVVSRCRKIYPFLPYEKGVATGSEFCVFDIPEVGRFGVCICYDQWFPEVSRSLMWLGAEVIICPTMTNTVDREAELAMARSNAIVNQCYFINPNVAGRMGNGKSIVVGPEGNVIHQAENAYEIIPFEVDMDLVKRVRERGMLGLGQVLKSYRDNPISFPAYATPGEPSPVLDNLGELAVPRAAGLIK